MNRFCRYGETFTAQESKAQQVRASDSFGGRLFFPPRAAGVLGPPATDWERREGEVREEREREEQQASNSSGKRHSEKNSDGRRERERKGRSGGFKQVSEGSG